MNLPETLTRRANVLSIKLQEHSPEILMTVGIVGVIGSTVLACRATLKADDILAEHKEKIDSIHRVLEETSENASIEYTEEDAKKDVVRVYTQASLEVAKVYAPAVILGTLSITSILASNNIMRKRNAALTAAYAAVDRAYRQYKKNVQEKYGEEAEKDIRYGLKVEEFEDVEVDENGKEKKKKVKETVICDELGSPYATWFDERSLYWQKDPDYNRAFLIGRQNYANDLLRTRGILFLNQVYDLLGLPQTKAGQSVGWVYDKNNQGGDNYVDFGLYDTSRLTVSDFLNGRERVVVLDFNVDGVVLNCLDELTNARK